MFAKLHRKSWIALLAAGVLFPAASCFSTDTESALTDWAATTTGNLVQILFKDFLQSRLPGANDPNLTAPISQQEQ